jgi:thiaminase
MLDEYSEMKDTEKEMLKAKGHRFCIRCGENTLKLYNFDDFITQDDGQFICRDCAFDLI